MNDDVMKMVLAQLDRIEGKVEKVDERLDAVEKVQIQQEANLREHMRRTDLLEKSHNDLKEVVEPLRKAHVVLWGVSKIVAGIGAALGVVATILKLIGLL